MRDEAAQGFEVVRDIAERPVEPLMVEQGFAEGVALRAVAERGFERIAKQPRTHGGDIDAGAVDALHGKFEGLARRRDHVVFRGDVVFEREAARADRVAAHEIVGGAAGEARFARIDEEAGDTAPAGGGVRLHIGDEEVGYRGVGDPGLFAVETPAAFRPFRAGADRGEVAARAGLAQCGRAEDAARDERGDVFVAVSRGGREGETRSDVLRVHHGEGEGHVGAGHFLA